MNKTEDDYTKGYGDGLKDAYDYWKRNGKLPEPASNTVEKGSTSPQEKNKEQL
jgi:hypothetical protein